MRATFMYGAGDVRVEEVADPKLEQPTDALVRIVRACVCGSDLHPHHQMQTSAQGVPMGHEFVGAVRVGGHQPGRCPAVRGGAYRVRQPVRQEHHPHRRSAPVRAYIEELLPEVLDGRLDPGRVFDRTVSLDDVPAGYQAMDDRASIKVLVTP